MNRQEQIQAVLNNFDFENVRNLMHQWSRGIGGNVPTQEELRSLARKLLEKAAEPTSYNCNSVAGGGFLALRWPWAGKIGTDCTMQLIFSVEDFEA